MSAMVYLLISHGTSPDQREEKSSLPLDWDSEKEFATVFTISLNFLSKYFPNYPQGDPMKHSKSVSFSKTSLVVPDSQSRASPAPSIKLPLPSPSH